MMNNDLIQTASRLRRRAALRKQANLIDQLAKSLTGLVGKAGETSVKALKVGGPVTALGLAWLLSRTQSPKGVADNAHNYAINSVLRQSLEESKRDLEQLLVRKNIENTNKFHDQYI